MVEFALLSLILVANGVPVMVRSLLGKRLEWPLDGHWILADSRPLFGPSKTIVGLVSAVIATTLLALLLGMSWWLGLLIGTFAMVGDLSSSFLKRRFGLRSGAMALGLDQIPESLLPLSVCKPLLALSWVQVLALTAGFLIADLLISQLMYRLGLGEHPY